MRRKLTDVATGRFLTTWQRYYRASEASPPRRRERVRERGHRLPRGFQVVDPKMNPVIEGETER